MKIFLLYKIILIGLSTPGDELGVYQWEKFFRSIEPKANLYRLPIMNGGGGDGFSKKREGEKKERQIEQWLKAAASIFLMGIGCRFYLILR
ncbi:MAG: hypothetical protein WBZ33_08425 [Thermoactinomyces sp.]